MTFAKRFIVLFLVPCLIAEPSLGKYTRLGEQAAPMPSFTEQALMLRLMSRPSRPWLAVFALTTAMVVGPIIPSASGQAIERFEKRIKVALEARANASDVSSRNVQERDLAGIIEEPQGIPALEIVCRDRHLRDLAEDWLKSARSSSEEGRQNLRDAQEAIARVPIPRPEPAPRPPPVIQPSPPAAVPPPSVDWTWSVRPLLTMVLLAVVYFVLALIDFHTPPRKRSTRAEWTLVGSPIVEELTRALAWRFFGLYWAGIFSLILIFSHWFVSRANARRFHHLKEMFLDLSESWFLTFWERRELRVLRDTAGFSIVITSIAMFMLWSFEDLGPKAFERWWMPYSINMFIHFLGSLIWAGVFKHRYQAGTSVVTPPSLRSA